VNAKMGPVIRVRRSSGLVSAEALSAAARVEPDRVPSAGWAIVENNRVAERVGERALTVGGGKANERAAAVSGDRCAGDVDWAGVAAA